MKKAPIPKNDPQRLEALKKLNVLDTEPEKMFDEITQMAAIICETKIALISLVDEHRQWFKSSFGLAAKETPRDVSFCGHAIMGNKLFEVTDAKLNPDFCDNPLFTQEPHVQFYAGVPLILSNQYRIGTLCVIDHKPKKLSNDQKKILSTLANQTVTLLEMRVNNENYKKTESQLERAQEIAKIGSWEYNLKTRDQLWTKEHYRIFEIPYPQSPDKLHELYRSRIHPDDISTLEKVLHDAATNGKDFVFNHRVYLDNGKRIKHVQGIGKVFKDHQNQPYLITGTCRDRTQEVENAESYQALMNTMNEGLVVQDSEGKIIEFNPAACEILGLTPDQLSGRTSYDPRWKAVREDGTHFPGEEHPSIRTLKSGKPSLGITMGLHLPSDQTRWIKINSLPFIKNNQKSVLTTFSDITALVESKNENRFILETLGIGVWKFDPKTKNLIWDRSLYQLYEINEKDFSHHYEAWEQSLTNEAKKQAIEDLELALSGKKEFDTTFEIKTKSGKTKFIGGKGKVVRDAQNMPSMMYGINWDRTREVTNEVELKKQKILLETVLQNIPNMVFVKDFKDNMKITLLNKAGETLLGINSSSLIGKNVFDFLPKEQAEFFSSKKGLAFKEKKSIRIENETLSSPSGTKFLRTDKVPTFDSNGNPDLLIAISTDITEELELKKKFEAEQAKALHSSKLAALGEMSAGIAHEINNPLSIITGKAELLIDQLDQGRNLNSKTLKSGLIKIIEAANRTSKVIKSLKSLARNSEKDSMQSHQIQLIVEETVDLCTERFKNNGINFKIDNAIQAEILSRHSQIGQILTNLLNNAFDAVQDSKQKVIELKVLKKNDRIHISVIDSGKGIPKPMREKIMQPFFTTKEIGKGTGLGLSISHQIAVEHGGKLFLDESQSDTCFVLELPIAKKSKIAA